MAETLQQGPIYFFDQPKTKRKCEKKKELESFANLISGSTDLHETGSFHRKPGPTKEHMDWNGALVDNSSAKLVVVPPQTYGSSSNICPASEKFHSQISQRPSPGPTEVLLPPSLDQYQSTAATVLQELEDMLNHLSKGKIIVPLGIVNILNYSWKDLVEGAWYNKKSCQELVYKNFNSSRRQASEMSTRLSSTSELTECERAEDLTRKSKKAVGFPRGLAKRSENPRTLLNKISREYADDSVTAISFSLSSEACKEKGWVSQDPDHDPKCHEWKGLSTEQLSKLKESGFDKPLILRHYDDARKETFPKYSKGYKSKRNSSQVSKEKLQLPVIKQTEPAIKKLHYQLIDGSSFIYYPSGHIAVCQSYADLPGGGFYTNIFNDFPNSALLGTFTPSGNGSVCIPNSSSNIVLVYNQKGGRVTNKDGEILRQWKWPGAGKLDDPVITQVNKYITVKIAGRFAVSLIYRWQHESVCLSLSAVQGVAVPQLGRLVNLSKDTVLPGIPEEDLSYDFSVITDLKKLKRKIKNILEQWMEYYQIALEISLPHIHKSSTFPPRGGREYKTPPACAFLRKNKSRTAAVTHNLPPLHSAVSPEPSRAPYLLTSGSKIKPVALAHVKKENLSQFPKARSSLVACFPVHTACPVVLQRAMLGEEAKICRCSNHQIPSVTDLEYDHVLNNQVSSPEQITVVCVTASVGAAKYDPWTDEHLEWLYERKNKDRSMPCTQGHLDSFRLLKYDINSADEFTGCCGSLLVKRHNIAPGMVLMYIQGKLLFANYIFNGYSKSAKDLQKQIAITRTSYNRGCYLPTDYIFSSFGNSLQNYPEHITATVSEDVSRGICCATERKESSCDFELFNLYKEAP